MKRDIYRIIAFFLVLVMALTVLVGCTGDTEDEPAGSDTEISGDETGGQQPAEPEQPPEPEPEPEPEPPTEPEQPEPTDRPAVIAIGNDVYGDFSFIPEPLDTRSSDDGNVLVLINKLHAVDSSYVPSDMVTVPDELMIPGRGGTEIKQIALDAFMKMEADASALGYTLLVNSTYRSYYTQESIYYGYVNRYGEATTNTFSAFPGRSEHHSGLTIDVTSPTVGYDLIEEFYDQADGRWVTDNCAKYGFIIRYPKGKESITGYSYEPWHLRYVGVDVAQEIMSKGITLEEYLGHM